MKVHDMEFSYIFLGTPMDGFMENPNLKWMPSFDQWPFQDPIDWRYFPYTRPI